MAADFLKFSNFEAVLVSSITSITADPHAQTITFRSDGKDFVVRIDGIPATLEVGFKILDEGEKSFSRVASIEGILNKIRSAVEH